MPSSDVSAAFDAASAGRRAHELATDLFPICRSITGAGVRESLRLLQRHVPLVVHEIPSGTRVFDWTVPDEWNIRDACIQTTAGERVVDFKKHALHLVSYSEPVDRRVSIDELRAHLTALPERPDWIPYRTSYYKRTWGFCLTQRQVEALTDPEYDVLIDSSLEPGHLSFGELLIPGETRDEVLISTHACHPAMANDNASGMVVATEVARALSAASLRYTYRFLWLPGTIGAITWLALNEATLGAIRHGLVLSCLGDRGAFTYKQSRRSTADIDRVAEYVLRARNVGRVRSFSPYGYDERQYCSPGINLPVGALTRTPNGEYVEYHSSADDLTLITPDSLGESVEVLLDIIHTLEANERWINLQPKCEPQLGRRGLYRLTGGLTGDGPEMAVLWVLNYADGRHDLLDVAVKSGLPFQAVSGAAAALHACGLLTRAGSATS